MMKLHVALSKVIFMLVLAVLAGTVFSPVAQAQPLAIDLNVTPTTFNENAGANAATGSVTRNGSVSGALTVTLTSSNTNQVRVPASVSIPPGAASATFPITAVSDAVVDGPTTVTITARATGFRSDTVVVTVVETDLATLNLSIAPLRFSEGAGSNASTGTVTRNTPTNTALTVNLQSSDTRVVTVPATVTIPVGAASATFPIAAVDDNVVTGNRTARITASAAQFASSSRVVTVTDNDAQTLTLSVTNVNISEAGGSSAATGNITRNTSTGPSITVTLTSSNPNRVTVPMTVVIPSGATSATFPIGTINNNAIDGNQVVTITATATGFTANPVTVNVVDDDASTLTVLVNPTTFGEAAGANAATGSVTRNTSTAGSLTVTLTSSNPSAVRVPATVIIPAGATSATFPIAAVDNTEINGNRTVSITASANGVTSPPVTVTVTDNDFAALTLAVTPTTISEAGGANAATGSVTRNTATNTSLVVNLFSSDTTEVRVPTTVTIPAGATSATFPIAAVNDLTVDGTQTVNITAVLSGFVTGRASIQVTDSGVTATPTPVPTATPRPTPVATPTPVPTPTPPPAGRATLFLTINPSTFSEAAGPNAALARVTRNTPTNTAVVVNLFSSNPNEVRVPASVTIPVGATFAQFAVTAVNDNVVDGSKLVDITAIASGFVPGSFRVTVTDAGTAPTPTPTPQVTATLTVSVTPVTFNENAGTNAAVGTVTRNTALNSPLTVNLFSSNTNRVRVPTTVIIPLGATFARFGVTPVDNTVVDGNQTVTITAIASNFVPGQAQVTVIDNDVQQPQPTPTPVATPTPVPTPIVTPTPTPPVNATLTLRVTTNTFSEAAGSNAAVGSVRRNTPTTSSLTVNLFSNDTTEATVPQSVIIPAGAAEVTFNIAAVNDNVVDGNQAVTITAIASGFAFGSANVTVVDDDSTVGRGNTSNSPPVTLSGTTISAASASLQLGFTGALNSELAGDPAHYAITVNGRSVAVESASYNARSRTVTLGYAEGALRAGDSVVIRWSDLQDASGRSVSGRAGPLIAR